MDFAQCCVVLQKLPMHLIPKSKLYGQPALHIRDFMRHLAMRTLGTIDETYIESRLQVSAAEAQTILAGLLQDGYVAEAVPKSGIPHFGMTAKGGQFAAASFARQIPRARGDEIVAGVLARAADIDAQRPFAFRITKIALFGSMLEDTPLVGDVDLAIHVFPMLDDARFDEVSQQRIMIAEDAGVRFRSRIHSIVWPRQEVTEYIRGAERYVSVHSFAELELLGCSFRILWREPAID